MLRRRIDAGAEWTTFEDCLDVGVLTLARSRRHRSNGVPAFRSHEPVNAADTQSAFVLLVVQSIRKMV